MKLIPLSKTGKYKGQYFAQVDDEDYDYLMKYNWSLSKQRKANYAHANIQDEFGIKKDIGMHRKIMKIKDQHILVDHKDHDGLNNQRSNLRIATVSQNMRNKKSAINSSSKYVGVTFYESKGKWVSRIYINGKNILLGSFENELDAAIERDKKAKELYGEFANLNFPNG